MGTYTAVFLAGARSGRWESVNEITVEDMLYWGRFVAVVTFSPRMFLSSFIQYNSSSDSLSSSVRFRWEYEPGSDLFVVYSEGREDLSLTPFLANRTFAVKFTKLFRF